MFLAPTLSCVWCDLGIEQLPVLGLSDGTTLPYTYAVLPGVFIHGSEVQVPENSTPLIEHTSNVSSGSGDPPNPVPPGNRSHTPPDDPVDPEDPGPEVPPIQVPETATIFLAGIGMLGFTVRHVWLQIVEAESLSGTPVFTLDSAHGARAKSPGRSSYAHRKRCRFVASDGVQSRVRARR
jgi:hypothetical protein